MSYRVSEPKGVLTVSSTGEGQTGFILQGTNITSGAAVLTVTTTRSLSVFTSADVGKAIQVAGAGVSGADLYTTILSFTSGTSVTLAANASTTVTNKSAFWYPVGQNDTTAIQAAINATNDSESTVYLPAGVFVISSTLTSTPYLKKFKGDGFNQTYIVTSSLAFTGDMLAFNSVGRGITVADIGFKHSGLATATTSATITAWQVTGGNTAIFTATNSYVAGQLVAISGFVGNGAPLNDSFITVSATGLTGSSFRGALSASNGSGTDTGIAHLDYNCLSFSISTVNTLIYANIDRVQMINAPGDGLKMASCVVSKVTQCVALSNNGHGFAIYNAANVGATSTLFDTCYANGNQQAGYYLHSVVYGGFNSCAADSNGVSYYLYSAKSISLNGCGSEATLNKNASYPGYHFYLHGGQGNVLNSCYTSSNSGIANTAGTFLVFDNTASNSSATNMAFAGSSNLPTNAFTIASGCNDIGVYEPYFSTIASTAWTDAGTNSTIFIDGTFQSQTGFNNTVFFANTATPIINQNSIANSDGVRMLIQAQGTSVDGYTGGELRLQGGTGFQSGTNSRGGDITIKSGSTAPTSLTTPDGYINFNLGNLGNFARWMNNGPTSLNSNVSTVALEFVKDNVTTPQIRIETSSTRGTATSLSLMSQSSTAASSIGGDLILNAGNGTATAGNVRLAPGNGTGSNTGGQIRLVDGYSGSTAISITPVFTGTTLITYASSVTAVTTSQSSSSVASTGAQMQFSAQSLTTITGTNTGGVLGLSAGNATGVGATSNTGGGVNISAGTGSGGTTNTNGNINFRVGSTTYIASNWASNAGVLGTAVNPAGLMVFNFQNVGANSTIQQNSTAVTDGYTFTVLAQNTTNTATTNTGGSLALKGGNSTGAGTNNIGGAVNITAGAASGAGTANTGGAVTITSGTGATAAGNVVLQTGGTTQMTVAPNAITIGAATTSVNTINGSNKFTTRTVSGNITIDTTTTDTILLVNTAAARTITLPAPTNGRFILLKDITGTAGTNNITLARNSAEKIDGIAASRVFSTNWGGWMIISDGTDWYVI